MIKDKELFRKLNNLKKIEPRLDWKKSNREILLSQIKAQTEKTTATKKASSPIYITSRGQILRFLFPDDFIWFKRMVTVAMRPLGTIILIIALVLGSGVAAVNASFNSLPGDTLYPIKLTAEKVQLGLNFNESDKVTLEIEFAGRRIEEFNKVTKAEDHGKEENIRMPLREFTAELGNVNARLENLNKTNQAETMVKLASLVDEKTENYSNALEAKRKEIPQVAKDIIKEAINLSEKTNEKAVGIMIENHNQVEAISKEMIAKKMEEKINRAEEKNKQLPENASKPEEVKKAIGEAKEFLESGDLASAFEKVKESNQLTRDALEAIEIENETKIAEMTAGEAAAISASETANTNITAPVNSNANTNTNSEEPAKVEGDAIINENASVSGSLLYEEKK